ncbi:MAG: 16S rRNA (adenine(1408)-N(1))-methyltransferase NpmA [Clostridia bacterium]|uniref:16S rRNA (adenine(1408)-N(1))-methyltransferase NpmC n=1 Tax=Clostridia bacterium TaxID=2044939 RepID=UPI003A604792|nr:16S rRNA (adenine(1408)-N(1))-methyltransferase NpmA [Clostridia bacterium]
MLILKGTKTVDLSKDELTEIISRFDRVHIDLGTGDGRNIYKLAINNPNTLFIGIDPVKENLFDISKKIIKKPSKGGLSNVVFVIAAAESLPFELKNIADSISILFPWGTLLEFVIKPNGCVLSDVADLAKNEANFEFVTTYSDSYEEAEIKKRGLPPLSKDYFLSEQYKAELLNSGFCIDDVKELDNEYVKQFNSLWAKRLAFGRKRSFFRVSGHVSKH